MKRVIFFHHFLEASREFAKVYRNGNLIGQIELGSKSGKWTIKSEKLV